jgi:asparagine synthase (glutamine-hydrolysing)
MSGICGILRFDGARPEGIEAMTAHLEQRGPEGTQHFRDGACALGHTLLAATPEALHEAMPLTHAGTGCTITADLRIDNREVLLPQLGLADAGRIIGDGEIVLHAYLKWGEDCPTHLLGDFAFAIWDPREQRIFAARDHMGMKQLIHCHVEGKVWAFASAPTAVLMARNVPRAINEGRLTDFLDGDLEVFDFTSTFFQNVYRLPPAHSLCVTGNSLKMRRYWAQEPGTELVLRSDGEYVEAFREVLGQAVRARLRAPEGTVGSMLSGGMDSGSVVALATRQFQDDGRGRFPTFSAASYEPSDFAEMDAITASMTLPNLDPTVIDHAQPGTWIKAFLKAGKESEEPFDTTMPIIRAVYGSAQNAGMKIVLDGVGGDLVFSSGSHIARLMAAGRFTDMRRELKGAAHFWEDPRASREIFESSAKQLLLPHWLRDLRRLMYAKKGQLPANSLVGPDLALRTNYADRKAQAAAHDPWRWRAFREERSRAIHSLTQVVGVERYDRTASQFGIEPRDPYTDQRLIDFCLSLPLDQLMRDGWPKYLQRTSMQGLLPDAVRWRRGRSHVGYRYLIMALTEDPNVPNTPAEDAMVAIGMLTMATGQELPYGIETVNKMLIAAFLSWTERMQVFLSECEGDI